MTNGVPCDSVRYMSHGIEYSNICGRAVGHTHSGDSTCGFWWSHQRRHSFDRYINGFYASGVTITRGPNNDRTHVWTYASGHKDKPSKWPFSIHCNQVEHDLLILSEPTISVSQPQSITCPGPMVHKLHNVAKQTLL